MSPEPEVAVERLGHGLTLLFERTPGRRAACIGFYMRCGAAHEQDCFAGMSHFAEHMVFKGTTTRTREEIDRQVSAVGAELNGAADKEFTCYVGRSLPEHIPLLVDIAADMLQNAVFPPEAIGTEVNVVLEEIARYGDEPEALVEDLIVETLWDGHPLTRNVLGSPEVVGRATQETCLEFIRPRYVPHNMVVAATGDLDGNALKRQLEEAFSDNRNVGVHTSLSAPEVSGGLRVLERDFAQVHLCLAAPAFPRGHPSLYPARVLSTALGSGPSSRLFREVREEEGLAYAVWSFPLVYSCAGAIIAYAAARPDAVGRIVAIIRRQFRELAERGLSDEELSETKQQVTARVELSLDDVGVRMERLGDSYVHEQRVVPVTEVLRKVAAVTNDDIRRVAAEMFEDGPLALAIVGPVDPERLEIDSWPP